MNKQRFHTFFRIAGAALCTVSLATPARSEVQIGISFPAGEGLDFSSYHLDNLNVRLFRFDVDWAQIEATEGEFDWGSGFDAQIKWALENNYSAMVTVKSTAPTWACDPGKENEHGCVPLSMADFQHYVETLMEHLDELLGLYSVLPVHAVQFGNEWGRGYPGSAAEFVEQANIVYDVLKSRFPMTPVVVGGLSPGHINEIAFCNGYDVVVNNAQPQTYCALDWYVTLEERTREVFDNARYDAVDVHLYWKNDEWPAYVDTLKNDVVPEERGGLPVFVTEFGGPRAGSEPIDEDYQATRMPDYLDAVLSLDIEHAYYFKLVDWGKTVYAYTGLIDLDRFEQQDPNPEKPSYWIFQGYSGVIPSPAPELAITSPIDGSEVPASDVTFTATATDDIDGDLGQSVLWTSDIDGVLGVGSPFVADLTPGQHKITATVTNSRGLAGYGLVNVTSLNTAPLAYDQSILTQQDLAIAIQLDFTDDGFPGPHSIEITREPIHGTLSELAFGEYLYTPDLGYSTEDDFRWRVNDGWKDSNIVTATIGIYAAPLAQDQIELTLLDAPILFSLALIDDGFPAPSTVTITKPPGHGTLEEQEPGEYLYTPDPGYNGEDVFDWQAFDGWKHSAIATATIGVNIAPIAHDQAIQTLRDAPVLIALDLDDDGYPGLHDVLITREPRHGTLEEQSPGELLYTPEAGYDGADDFRWKVHDGHVYSNIGTVTIAVDLPPNETPIANDQSVQTLSDEPISIALDWVDEGFPGPYSVLITREPIHGSIEEQALGVYLYTPDPGYYGVDDFRWKIHDGREYSNIATVTIAVDLPPNETPIANDQSVQTLSDEPISIALDWVDEGFPGPYSVLITREPIHGSIEEQALGVYLYTPDPGYYGVDDFRWKIHDGHEYSNIATVTIAVDLPPNETPIANDQSVQTLSDEPISIALDWVDEGFPGPYSVLITREPIHGSIEEQALGVYLYTPDPGYYGVDDFRWKVHDGREYSNIATVTIAVDLPPNETPIANDQSVQTLSDEPISIALDWVDEGFPGPYSVLITREPIHGSIEEQALGVYLYTPDPGYYGVDDFRWKIHDGREYSNIATVTIAVDLPPNETPIANDQSVQTLSDEPISIALDWVDEGFPGPYSVLITREPIHGSIEEQALGVYLYTPDPGYYGVDDFRWKIHDGREYSNIATAAIGVLVP